MLSFDKMKIVAPLRFVKSFDGNLLMENRLGGDIISRKFTQSKPYNLSIQMDYNHNELVIEFMGTILGDSYPLLINRGTFLDCLRRIESLGIISMDKEGVLTYGEVNKCDVTCDITYSDLDALIKFIKANLSSYDKWETTRYPNGIKLQNKVSTEKLKKRIVIYDKDKEIQMARNNAFRSTLKNDESLLSYYKGKIRFERNLNTKAAIRKALNIQGNSIEEVLNSCATPIADILNEAVKPAESKGNTPSTPKDVVTFAVLNQYNFNLTQIEAAFRAVMSKNTRMSRIMKPYKEYQNRSEVFDFNSVINAVS